MDTLTLRLAADRAEVEAYQARGTANEAAAQQAYMAARDAYRIEQIAVEHARDIEDQLAPHERRACLAAEAVFSDYMDEWQSLASAFARVVGRHVWTLADVDAGRCTGADLDADHDLIYNAMDASNYMLNTH